MLRRGAGSYTLRDEMLLKDGAPTLSIREAASLTGRIVRFTLIAESTGALILASWFAVAAGIRPRDAIWNGLFYAISGLLQWRF